MGSRMGTGGRLPAGTQSSGADHEASPRSPAGPPPERRADTPDGAHDTNHVTLTGAELQRLLHPKPAAD